MCNCIRPKLVGNFYQWLQLSVNYVSVQEWCVEQRFELVELNPELDPEWEEEQDFIETTGIKRVVQAMHAHLWPNLHMKGKGLYVTDIMCCCAIVYIGYFLDFLKSW